MNERPTPAACAHPPARRYAWIAYDGTPVVGCCVCGAVLCGAAEDTGRARRPMHRHTTIVRHRNGSYALYSPDGFLHIDATLAGILDWSERLGSNRRRLAFRYY